ncbi:MAG: hypothetical protein AB1942_00130 [Pseudomonadota bacterium]
MRTEPARTACRRMAWGAAILAALLAPGLATAQPYMRSELRHGGRIEVLSAYLRADVDPAVVAGQVRRAEGWRGPVSGHLHVEAFDAGDRRLVLVPALWRGRPSGRHAPMMPYTAQLGVPRADVARLTVSWAPGRHDREAAP